MQLSFIEAQKVHVIREVSVNVILHPIKTKTDIILRKVHIKLKAVLVFLLVIRPAFFKQV